MCVVYVLTSFIIRYCYWIPSSSTQWHRAHGIDTFFLRSDSLSKCGTKVSLQQLIEELSPKYGFHSIVDVAGILSISTETNVLAVFTSDEADNKVLAICVC